MRQASMSDSDLSALTVRAEWDSEAGVWVAESDDVPGLVTEADTLERLVERLRVLVPELRAGDIVIMDNLSSHKAPAVRAMIEAAGAKLLYLLPPAFAGAGSTVPTSTRSRMPSPSSRHFSGRWPHGPFAPSGTLSQSSSRRSSPRNALTSSPLLT